MANKIIFTVDYKANDPEKPLFDVISFEGREAISIPYTFKIALRSKTDAKDTIFINKRATLGIIMDDTEAKPVKEASSAYRGVIASFSRKDKIGDYYHYDAVIVPRFAFLGLFKKSDIFIDTPLYTDGGDSIMGALLKEGGFAGEEYHISLKNTGKYAPYKDPYNRYAYVCQYEETDLDFMSRLMEREGIYYYFEQPALKKDTNGDYTALSTEQSVFTDTKDIGITRNRKLRYRFLPNQSVAPDPNAVNSISLEQKMLPGKVTIMNYDYEKASLDDKGVISCSAFVSKDNSEDKTLQGEVRIYGENFVNPDKGGDGDFLATIRAQEIFCQGSIYSGRSTAVPLMPGMKVTLDESASASFKGDYLITEVTHHGQQQLPGMDPLKYYPPFYGNEFTMIRSDVQFRPKRITPGPKIYGTLNAVVDGDAESEYAQMDDKGRYKVKFPFLSKSKDQGKGSVWIRMSSPYAGASDKTYGIHFPLHKGAEVALAFRDGNPDQPFISGALFNSQNKNVVTNSNSSQGIIKSAGGHKLVMEDKEGQKSIGLFCSHGGDEGTWFWAGNESSPTWDFKTKGNKHEVICGQEDSVVLGAENYITVGSNMEAIVGNANELILAQKFVAELAGSIEFKGGHHIEFGKETERIKDSEELVGIQKVSLGAGLDPGEKAAMGTARKAIYGGIAALGAALSAGAGNVAASAYPHEEEGAKALPTLGVTMAGILGGIIAQVVALNRMVNNLKTELLHPVSEIALDGSGIEISTKDTAREGTTIGVKRGDEFSSSLKIKAGLQRGADRITLINNEHAKIEMIDGDSITIMQDTGNNDGTKIFMDNDKVEIQKGSRRGKITIKNDSIVAGFGMGNGQVTIKQDLCRIEQAGKSISIDQNNIKMKFGGNELTLSPAAIEQNGTFIKLG